MNPINTMPKPTPTFQDPNDSMGYFWLDRYQTITHNSPSSINVMKVGAYHRGLGFGPDGASFFSDRERRFESSATFISLKTVVPTSSAATHPRDYRLLGTYIRSSYAVA